MGLCGINNRILSYASASTTPWTAWLGQSAQTDHNTGNKLITSDATGIETNHTLVFTFRYMGSQGADATIRHADDNIMDAYAHDTIGQGFVFMMDSCTTCGSQSTGTVTWYNGSALRNSNIIGVDTWMNVIISNTGSGWDTWVHTVSSTVSSTEYKYVPYGGFNPNATNLTFHGYPATNVVPHTWDEIIISDTTWSTSTRHNYWNNYWDVAAPPPTPSIASTSQNRSDCITSMTEGTSTSESTMCFKAQLNSSSSNGLRLQVEISTSTSFTNVRAGTSTLVAIGSYASATITAIPSGNYYWRGRAIDEYTGATSSWALFGASGTVDFVVNVATSSGWDCSVSTTGYFPLDGNTNQPCGTSAVTLTSPSLPYASATTTPWTSFLNKSAQTDNGLYMDTSNSTGIQSGHTLVFTFRHMGSNGTSSVIRNNDDNIMDAYNNGIGHALSFLMNSSGTGKTGTVTWYNGIGYNNTHNISIDQWINVIIENTGSGWDTWVHTIDGTEYNYVPYGSFNPAANFIRFWGYPATNVKPHTWDEIIISNTTWSTSTRQSYWDNYWDPKCVEVICSSFSPIVIVPGIMGTRLNRASDTVEVWPRGSDMFSSSSDDYLNDLKLSSTSQEIVDITKGNIIEEELSADVYINLIDLLESKGYSTSTSLFIATYDWRFSVASSVSQIATVIQNAISQSSSGKITVIAHSMGGLLMKQYLKNATNTTFIDKLILAGVPQLGSPVAFETLNYGYDFNLNVPLVNWGLNENKAKEIAQNMPGVYDLLPGRRYIDVNGGYVQDFRATSSGPILDYDQTSAYMTSSSSGFGVRNSSLLSLSDNFHQSIDTQQFNITSSSVYNIAGCNGPTIGTYNIGTSSISVHPVSGDGTVPLTSAINLSSGYHSYFVEYDDDIVFDDNTHVGLIKDDDPLDLIEKILDNNLNGSFASSIATSTTHCWDDINEMDVIATHSPVDLHIYDEQGRHTGPNIDKDRIDQEIPGTIYNKIDHNSFVFIPSSKTYKIVVQATGIGEFTLNIDTYDKFQLRHKVEYSAVPVPKIQTRVEAIVTPSNKTPVLQWDLENDKTIDSSYSPSSVQAFEVDYAQRPVPPTLVLPPQIIQPNTPATSTLDLPVSSPSSSASSTAILSETLSWPRSILATIRRLVSLIN